MLLALGLSLAGCAQPRPSPQYRAQIADVVAPRPQSLLPASTDTAPRPWALGQWAIYKTTATDGAVGYMRFDVISVDGCGTWVRLILQGVDVRRSWSVCVRDQPDGRKLVAYVVDNADGAVVSGDFRDDPRPARYLALFMPPVVPAGSSVESVDVPYGHVDGATRSDRPRTTTWSHPAVPFTGLVKQQSHSGGTTELLSFGDHGVESIVPEIARAAANHSRSSSWLWASGGAGLGIARGYRREDSDGSSTYRLRGGTALSPSVDFMTEIVGVSSESDDQISKQDSTVIMAGARWRPFTRSRSRVLNDLHLRGGLGVSFLDRTMSGATSTEESLAGSVGVVLVARMTRSLSVAMDLGDDMQVSGAGTRHNLLATGMLEVRWDRN